METGFPIIIKSCSIQRERGKHQNPRNHSHGKIKFSEGRNESEGNIRDSKRCQCNQQDDGRGSCAISKHQWSKCREHCAALSVPQERAIEQKNEHTGCLSTSWQEASLLTLCLDRKLWAVRRQGQGGCSGTSQATAYPAPDQCWEPMVTWHQKPQERSSLQH